MKANPINKGQMAEEVSSMRHLFTKSVTALTDLSAGTLLRAEHLTVKKPGSGIPADQIQTVIGRRLKDDVKQNQILRPENLHPQEKEQPMEANR
jgi:N-acetylneuraminate synthase